MRVSPQYLIPHHLLSRLMYRLTRCRWSWVKAPLIRCFIWLFKVDTSESAVNNPLDHPDFNSFFTRPLKPSLRPLDQRRDSILSPVDGRISQIGTITEGDILQAKNKRFSVSELLAHDTDVRHFTQGSFVTLYLSPADYHRVHMPVDGTLCKDTYIPGRLFAVNPHTCSVVDSLFARNERLVCYFETSVGKMAMVLVGAIFVGNMETVWSGEVTPSPKTGLRTILYEETNGPIVLKKGFEMGRFNMGSTVILLFEKDQIKWKSGLAGGDKVQMGQAIGYLQNFLQNSSQGTTKSSTGNV